jgi:hypothetical protein
VLQLSKTGKFANFAQEHPWVTKNATDPLPSEEENTSDVIEPPTEEEMNEAITKNLNNLLVVVRYLSRSMTDSTNHCPVGESCSKV